MKIIITLTPCIDLYLQSPIKTVPSSTASTVAKIWSSTTEIEAAASQSHSSLLNDRPLPDQEMTHIDAEPIIFTPYPVENNVQNLLCHVARDLYSQPVHCAALPPVVCPQTVAQPAATYGFTSAAYPNHPRDNGSSDFNQLICEAKKL